MPDATAVQREPDKDGAHQPLNLSLFHFALIFALCSFVGLVGEILVSFILDGRWESRAGFVFGPFSPIYGVGAMLITLVVNPLRGRNALVQFVVAGLLGGLFEFFAGWFLEEQYGIVAWSYVDQPFNFHGHTSLAIACVWGAIGLVWIRWALPCIVRLIERIPENVRRPLTIVLVVFFVADGILTLGAFDCWFKRLSGIQPEGAYQQFFATWFDDAFMQSRFETMSLWPVLANR